MKSYVTCGLAFLMVIFSFFGVACTENRVDDALLTARIKTQMTAGGRVSPTRVNVDTLNGDVTLRGEVPTQEERDAAEEVARNVQGVRSVNNQITINPAAAAIGVPTGNEMKQEAEKAASEVGRGVKEEAGNIILLGEIKARLAAAGYTGVTVGVEQGVVTLSGEAASNKDRIAVEAIVEKISGVSKLNNQLSVKAHSATPTPTPGPTPSPTPKTRKRR